MARICVPVCVRQVENLRAAIEAADHLGDFVELRADCLPGADPGLLLQTAAGIEHPLILTLRSPEEGGQAANDIHARRRFWSALTSLPADSFIDLELDLVEEFSRGESSGKLQVDWKNVICSYHDFAGVPDNLEIIFNRMAATPAGIIKIAVQAQDAPDCLTIFKLLNQAQGESRQLIAVAMGQAGVLTRILGPSRGSFLTYGSLSDESGTAPGQLTAVDLRDVYRIDRIDRETQIFGVIGDPVSHSLSPHIHNSAFAANGMNAVFIPFEVREALPFIRRMAHPKTREIDWKLKGLSVTAPHKSSVMQALDWIDPASREIGAVNTIVVQDHQLCGYNTDATGFIEPLRHALGTLRNLRCAVVGAGGAARACVWGLKQDGADVTIFARDQSKAEFLANTFGISCAHLSLRTFREFDVVINATPVGTRGETENESIATADQLRGVRLAYDLVYNPSETQFLREARIAGCEVLGGIEMLLAQAVEQFRLWMSTEPDISVMRASASHRLQP